MSHQMRLRLICAAVGIAVLPAFDALIFLLDHSSLRLAEWPLPLILLAFILCPSILLVAFQALGGNVSALWWVLAALINGTLYAAIGPVFWRLLRNIKKSVFN
jgi:hypothetical protein